MTRRYSIAIDDTVAASHAAALAFAGTLLVVVVAVEGRLVAVCGGDGDRRCRCSAR